MHNWTNFCNIIKFNLKSKSLVAQVAAGLFLDKELCSMLEGMSAYIVPPELDFPREIKINKVNKVDENKFSFSADLKIEEYELIVGKSLLLSKIDIGSLFGETINMKNSDLIGKTIEDKMLGKIGEIVNVAGTSAQKHVVVETPKGDVLIPFVSDFIIKDSKDKILMNLPDGLIEVNNG